MAAPITPESTDVRIQSSPLKPPRPMVNPANRNEWSKYVYSERDVVKTVNEEEMISQLCPNVHADVGWLKAANSQSCDNSPLNILKYLNELSAKMAKVKPSHKYNISFIETPSDAPKDHPTGTTCRPDFVGYRKEPRRNLTAKTIKWSQIQATGEIFSQGDSDYKTRPKAGSYVAYNLQARPDLVSGSGLRVKGCNITVYLINASKIYTCDTILPKNSGNVPALIYAFMWNLYHPIVDPSLSLNLALSRPIFSIRITPDIHHKKLSILRVGDPLGRRTMIFEDLEDSSVVIKEQYIQPGRRFREGRLLDKIHADGSHFPGIVRHGYHGEVEGPDKKVILTGEDDYTRIKTRLVLHDKGKRFAELETPRDMLMIAYDVLEVIRVLHRTRNILHRDISSGNILFRPLTEVDPTSVPPDIGDMCFSHYLLESLDTRDDASNSPTVNRLSTSLLLADFDSAQDQTVNGPGECMARTGTSTFMAVALRNNGTLAIFDEIPSIPTVHEAFLPCYQTLLPGRLRQFPKNEAEVTRAKAVRYGPESKHILRYDTESVFWCMVWWLIQAKPAGSMGEKIDLSDWLDLVGVQDKRYRVYISTSTPFPLHSKYAPISSLLENMADHLRINLDLSKDRVKRDEPEYLCEVFQRLILNFLVEHRNAEYLCRPKDVKWRDIEEPAIGRATNSQSTVTKTSTNGHGASNLRRGPDRSAKRSHEEMAADAEKDEPQSKRVQH